VFIYTLLGSRMPVNHAQGTAAWDDAGAEYVFRGGFVDPRDAARALKHGARLGILEDWGMDEAIDWIDVPVFRGSNALPESCHRKEDGLVRLRLPGAIEVLFEVQAGGRIDTGVGVLHHDPV